jgi:predicted nucleic acid-binding protein
MAKAKIRIYADTNVYGRPFDDLSISKIALEAEAARLFFEKISRNVNFILLGSDILKLEIQRIKDIQKKFWILPLTSLCREWIEESESIKKLAQEIFLKVGLLPRDSIHLASAISGKARYFLTCDEYFFKKSDIIENKYRIKVVNPIDFLKIL